MNAIDAIELLPRRLQSFAIRRAVPLVGTVGLRVEEISPMRAVVKLANRRRARNHLGGVHAAALALCAETATGLVVGASLPGGRVPLLQSMSIEYRRRIKGGITAVATLDHDARHRIRHEERGDLIVPVEVRDDDGQVPAECTFRWAWR